MKPEQVRIGETYLARLNRRTVPVRVERVDPFLGWWVRNLLTDRLVKVKSAGVLKERGGR